MTTRPVSSGPDSSSASSVHLPTLRGINRCEALPEEWTHPHEWKIEKRESFESWKMDVQNQIAHIAQTLDSSLRHFPHPEVGRRFDYSDKVKEVEKQKRKYLSNPESPAAYEAGYGGSCLWFARLTNDLPNAAHRTPNPIKPSFTTPRELITYRAARKEQNVQNMVTLSPPQGDVTLRTSKESKHGGFPEHLKHADILGDSHTLKISSSSGLFHAVLKGRIKATKFLLDHCISINGRNGYGYNVLIAALHIDDEKKRRKMFELLLRSGADPFFKDVTHGRSVLQWACTLGRHEQMEKLLQELAGEVDLNDKDAEGYTALHHAVMGGHLPLVRRLVEQHRKFAVSVDVTDELGLTPYMHAKRLGHREVAEHLREVGQASQGHGDLLFRSPREWSQIGRFERQQAVRRHVRDAINLAKIQGKVTTLRHLENGEGGEGGSQKRGLHKISVASSSTGKDGGIKLAARAPRDRVSVSLPTLSPELIPEADEVRPSSAGEGQVATSRGIATGPTAFKGQGRGRFASRVDETPRRLPPPRFAFGSEVAVPESETAAGVSGDFLAVSARNTFPLAQPRPAPSHRRGSIVQGAMTLLQREGRGKHVEEFRHSQFDTSKADEYQHMLGNLNAIMDMLSQQQSKSFRQSVRYQRPETPKKKKPKKKVSTLAIILGRNKSGRRSNQRAPRLSGASSGPVSSAARKADRKVKDKAVTSGDAKRNVPKLKVNDQLV